MSSRWPEVRLGEVIREDREAVGSADGEGLPVLGVTNTEGVTHTGVEASDDRSKYLRLRPGRFVYNPYRINVGSIGLSAPSQDGICSPAYVVFTPTERINSHFLRFFLKSARGNQLINFHGNRGSVRSALRFDDLCKIEIPLPSLAEQRRVVARIEELAAQVYEARTLRQEINAGLGAMLAAVHCKIAANAPRRPLSEVAPLNRRPVTVDDEKIYPGVAVRSFGRGTFHKPPLVGSDVTWEKPFLVRAGDILVSNIKAWEGALAVAKPEDDGRVGSHRYLTCVPIKGVATPRFVCFYLLTPEGLHEVSEASPGSADRNRTLGAKAFMRIPIPVPKYNEQQRFETLCAEVDALKRLQAETTAELVALLPSILDKAFKGEL
jgi:type I restriction enzyme, S subunit